MFPLRGRLQLQLERLPDTESTASVLQQYFDALAKTVKAFPACWQGWDWYDTLPDALSENAHPDCHPPP